MSPLHERLRLRQGAWDRLGNTYVSLLVRGGLTSGLVVRTANRMTGIQEATELVATLLLPGAIVPCEKDDLWGISAGGDQPFT